MFVFIGFARAPTVRCGMQRLAHGAIGVPAGAARRARGTHRRKSARRRPRSRPAFLAPHALAPSRGPGETPARLRRAEARCGRSRAHRALERALRSSRLRRRVGGLLRGSARIRAVSRRIRRPAPSRRASAGRRARRGRCPCPVREHTTRAHRAAAPSAAARGPRPAPTSAESCSANRSRSAARGHAACSCRRPVTRPKPERRESCEHDHASFVPSGCGVGSTLLWHGAGTGRGGGTWPPAAERPPSRSITCPAT